MDNIYGIGYRIDVKAPRIDISDFCEKLESSGLDVDILPGKTWMCWESVEESTISVWAMKKYSFVIDYRCPIDRAELWEDMHQWPFDVPETYAEDVKEIEATDMFKQLVKQYGKNKVRAHWGLALFLG